MTRPAGVISSPRDWPPLKPLAAALAARSAITNFSGHALHLEFDRLSNEILRSLGYGEFVEIFERAIADGHGAPTPPA